MAHVPRERKRIEQAVLVRHMLSSKMQLNTSSNSRQLEGTRHQAGPNTNICTGEYNLEKEVNRSIQRRGEESNSPTELHALGV